MKNLIFKCFCFYDKYFPFDRGKHFFSRILTNVFSTFIIKSKSDIYLEVFVSSSQDMHLVNIVDNKSDNIANFINELKSGDVFVDIGANIGLYSFLASRKVKESGKIFSFEPSVREYKRFLTGLMKNECENIIPYNMALSANNGQEIFSVSEYHTGLNKLGSELESVNSTIICPTFRFDFIFESMKISEINLVKLDVEGAEFLVLTGMRESLKNKRIKKIIIEITPKFLKGFGHTKEQLYDFMSEMGYNSTVNSNEWQFDEIFIPNVLVN
jgi:FkbM family methyltransferase